MARQVMLVVALVLIAVVGAYAADVPKTSSSSSPSTSPASSPSSSIGTSSSPPTPNGGALAPSPSSAVSLKASSFVGAVTVVAGLGFFYF
ncbi:hypothetical protein ES332_A11G076700v1 [Gossypium tomentosum]|uniref:Uncharacterized protein n=1 Tax=Gossypium tomentosum TaxID=34277 RepID=A0A5D2N7V7_GOSTO|nr:hypothetical protein ES332_A11G076700v1 [Gossypium tomentosum]